MFIDGSWKVYRNLVVGWRSSYGTISLGSYPSDMFTGYLFVGLNGDSLASLRTGLYHLDVSYVGNKNWPAATKHLRVRLVE